ncbi:nucleotide exchange factor GrpE [Tautonia rosea]|uniref:nucleotide exchange factor GrpE n=1 Tax=Tautonia rosea TaxID=2728037 RepID=UPI001474B372|nr:nucleotide exchange factor GrpE [Tautonia rosea]
MSDATRPEETEVPPETEEAQMPSVEPEAVEVAMIMAASAYEVVDTWENPAELRIEPEQVEAQEPTVDSMAPVLEAITQLGGRMDRLQAVMDREFRAESSREKVVDRLHAELQEYKNDLLLKITKPIFIDLIQLHDDLGKMADAIGGADNTQVLRDVQQGLEDILYRQGVEPFGTEDETFDPRRQRAVSTVPTDDPGQAKRIAVRLRPGFSMGEKVIRPELVSVYALNRSSPS